MDKIEGYDLLKKIVDKEIFHQDYERVTTLAEKYYKLKTGDNIESLLQQIETRTTEEEFAQIKRIYRSIIPSTLNSTKMPFLQAARTDPNKTIDFTSGADIKVGELQGYIDTYWGDKSVDKYLEYAFVDYNYIDPNAFLITEFDPFDARVEKASPYPFIADSTQAVTFEYKNEILQYLVVKLPNKYMDGDTEHDGVKYTMYLGMDTIVFNQVAGRKFADFESEIIEIKAMYFEVLYYEPKNDKVPAIRFGYNRDEQTKGRTFVSVFHPVIGLLEKTLKIDSELDLSTAMVAFPQRFAYTSPCPGGDKGCRNGRTIDGKEECPICHGSGAAPAHKGTQDIHYLALPHDPKDMIDLNNMLVYKGPDIELLQFDADYLKSLKETIYAAIFNKDRYLRSDVSVTATQVLDEGDDLNNTLFGFGSHYSSVWKFVVRDIATFIDLGKGLILSHQFYKDFKLKSVQQLFVDLKAAKDANAAPSTVDALQADINKKLYADRPDDLKRMDIKNKFNPFGGYSGDNIRFIIAQGGSTKYNIVLWENYESIWQDLEFENVDPWIYDLADNLIRTKVKAKTQEYMALIEGEKQADMEQEIAQEQATQSNNFTN